VGIKLLEVVCDENAIGGDGEYCGDNDAQVGRFSVLSHGTKGGKCAPRAVLFDLEPGVIGALRASPLGDLFRPGNLVNQDAGAGYN
jgi:tubulin beta